MELAVKYKNIYFNDYQLSIFTALTKWQKLFKLFKLAIQKYVCSFVQKNLINNHLVFLVNFISTDEMAIVWPGLSIIERRKERKKTKKRKARKKTKENKRRERKKTKEKKERKQKKRKKESNTEGMKERK